MVGRPSASLHIIFCTSSISSFGIRCENRFHVGLLFQYDFVAKVKTVLPSAYTSSAAPLDFNGARNSSVTHRPLALGCTLPRSARTKRPVDSRKMLSGLMSQCAQPSSCIAD